MTIFHPFLGGWGRKKVSYGAVDLSNDYGHGHRQAYRLGKYIKRNDQFKFKFNHSNTSKCQWSVLFISDALDTIAIKWLENNGFPGITKLTQVLENYASPQSSLVAIIQDGLDKANLKAVSNAQRVQKWVLLERDFSMAMNELTPTLKMKRATITKMYKDKIDTMYT